MRKKNLSKGMLCLLMGMLCNVMVAQTTLTGILSADQVPNYHGSTTTGGWYGKIMKTTTPTVTIEVEDAEKNSIGWSTQSNDLYNNNKVIVPWLRAGENYIVSLPEGCFITGYTLTTRAKDGQGIFKYTTADGFSESEMQAANSSKTVTVTGLNADVIEIDLSDYPVSSNAGIFIWDISITYIGTPKFMPEVSEAPADGRWAANSTWYRIKNGKNNVIRTDALTTEGYLALNNTSYAKDGKDLWCIVGNATDGYTFYSLDKGPDFVLGMKGSEANARAEFVEKGKEGYVTEFDFVPSTKDDGSTWWCVKEHGSKNNYWNERSSLLAYWENINAVKNGDAGSALLFSALKSVTSTAAVTAEWLNEECVDVAVADVPAGIKDKCGDYIEEGKVLTSRSEYLNIDKGHLSGLFNWRSGSGSKRVNIVGVEVVDLNGAVVAYDYHWGYAGNPSSNNVYSMNVTEPGLYYLRYYAETKSNGGINDSDIDITYTLSPLKTDLYNTSRGALEIPPHRIPGITVDPETGRIITTAARLVCGTDPGYGQVDVVCRISDDHGAKWTDTVTVARGTGKTSPTENFFNTAFGDPAVVADRTSNEVLIIVVAGCTKYQTATRAIPNMIGTIHSTDNGDTWGEPVDVTEPIYSLFDSGNPMQAAFVGGGKIFQSRIVKKGQYYRLYAAMCARPNGNRVIYSDDFGRTWHALGGASALPAPGGDEPKCEELPDGRVILSSRVGGGRIYNIYTYSNTLTAEGEWGTSVKSTFEGSGKTPGGNSTNGEILIVPVKRNSDQKEMYLALQSLPTGSGRSNVGIFYKELTDVTDVNSVANFATDWNGFYLVTDKTSAYSSMDLQNDDRIGFIYEENYTKHGVVSNPHSIPFPDADNLGTHNYDGYDNIYVAYDLEYITNGAYSISRDVDRRAYLQTYFTDLTADVVDEVKNAVAADLEDLSTEPTIDEIDNIYFNIGKGSVITAANANAGKVGYYLDDAVATYKEEVMAAMTREQLVEAETKLIATNEWNMPVSGKAYTFKSVQKDGTTVRWFKYDGEKIVLATEEADATPFVCRQLDNGKYVFVCNEGKYMIWRGYTNSGTTTGVYDAYDVSDKKFTDITIEKMTTGNNISGDQSYTRYLQVKGQRNDSRSTETAYIVVQKSKTNNQPDFDGANVPFYNDNYSSAIIMDEVEYANTPKLNSVGMSELLSEDLHNKAMGTFSAPFPTVVPEGVTAYTATKTANGVALNAIEGAIPANTGVILVGETADNVTMKPVAAEAVATVTENALGHSAGASKENFSGYILTAVGGVPGFYQATTGTLAMNKAYIAVESGAQAIRVTRGSEDDATGIENSGFDNRNSAIIYDLAGRRVEKMVKGIYIVNGRKVVK